MSENPIIPTRDESENVADDKIDLFARDKLEKMADVYEKQGEAALTEELEKIFVLAGGKYKRQDIDRVHRAAKRIVKDRERARAKQEKARAIENKLAKKLAKEKALAEMAEISIKVGSVFSKDELGQLKSIIPREAANKIEEYVVPPRWRLSEHGVELVDFLVNDDLSTTESFVRVSPVPILIAAQILQEEKESAKYLLTYRMGTWRTVHLDAIKNVAKAGIPVFLPRLEKALIEYINDFVFNNEIITIVDRDAINAMDHTIRWIRENTVHFITNKGKRYGKFARIEDEAAIVVSKTNLRAELEQENFVWKKVITSWKKRGWLITTKDDKVIHNLSLDGMREQCIVFRRKAIDPDFVDYLTPEERTNNTNNNIDKSKPIKPATISIVDKVPVYLEVCQLNDEDEIINTLMIKEIVPWDIRENENQLPCKTLLAQAILTSPISSENEKKIITVEGVRYLIKPLPLPQDLVKEEEEAKKEQQIFADKQQELKAAGLSGFNENGSRFSPVIHYAS